MSCGKPDCLIHLENVWTTYEGAECPVIRDISFDIRAGEFVVIGGPNGAGKTTLLEAITGLLPIVRGSVTVCGMGVLKEATRARCSIGYVIQNFDFHPFTPYTVEEVVRMGRYGKIGWFRRETEEDVEAARDAMRTLRIDHLKDELIGKLSGGQQQKVLIAHNLAKKPSVLLLDEPYSNLDIRTRDEVSDILCQICDSGVPVMMVSHAFDSLPDRDIRVIVMQTGKLVLNTVSKPDNVANLIRSVPVAG
ncbi:MAG TPA: metal ABC transporter ATP-binding protein [Methanospirillum sp.]|uniref:metal ABC transporter ATP-binding protein n=1 Tax=Methanospirillum sp. TaxID=45200 RepID=UPI002C5174DC|nr:metal ABC transporter ATP-binding protein [Methanospirillum sp.]HWQ65009.1 metal ABC transporter ATP-binding protein [Methanospirillum sp.]